MPNFLPHSLTDIFKVFFCDFFFCFLFFIFLFFCTFNFFYFSRETRPKTKINTMEDALWAQLQNTSLEENDDKDRIEPETDEEIEEEEDAKQDDSVSIPPPKK